MSSNTEKRPGHVKPAGYNSEKYEKPSVAADTAILCFEQDTLKILLIKRKHDPYKDYWALPGGFVDMDEALEDAAAREVKEETGVTGLDLIPIGSFGDPGRDPRTRVISSVYMALVRAGDITPRADDDASEARWWPFNDPPELAFDHDKITAAVKEKLSETAVLTPRLFELLPARFTGEDIIVLAGEITGIIYNDSAFFESIERAPGFELLSGTHGRSGTYSYDRAEFHIGDFLFMLLSDKSE